MSPPCATTAAARTARSRLHRLAVVSASLLLALPAVVGLLPLPSPARPSETSARIEIRQATFTDTQGRAHPALPLPDTWAQRGQAVQQPGRYTVRFTLAAAPGVGASISTRRSCVVSFASIID